VSQPLPTDGATPSKESLRLWLRLLACENIVESRLRTALRDEFGVTLPQFDVLAELEYLGRPLTMTGLSKRLMVSNGNVTGVVDRLAREGLVERQPSPEDRRVHLIRLTPAGRELFYRIAECHERWIHELFSGVSREKIRQLANLLAELHETLKTKEQGSSEE
jgi:DNA-binding MarR family transcriptional regulator